MSEFAFGDNSVSGVGCPAMQAGFDPIEDEHILRFTEQYDECARNLYGDDEGVVDEESAKRAWRYALQRVDRCIALKRGEDIADILGWEIND